MKDEMPACDACVVAIDGPAASGKSTVARRVAVRLDRLYVDSGALYRAVTWKALEQGLDVRDSRRVVRLAESVKMEFFETKGAVWFRIDGDVLDRELRTEEINANVSPVAAVSLVRARVVEWLCSLVRFGPLVMEGRDIGTAVFPHSPWKFYLDASPEERTRRRHAETAGEGAATSVAQVGDSLRRRDQIDSGRRADPLRTASGAVIIDSTHMGIDEVVNFIVGRVNSETQN